MQSPTSQSPGSGLNLLSGRPSIPAWQLASRPVSAAPPEVKGEAATGKGKEKEKGGEDLAASGVLVQGESEVASTEASGTEE